MKRLKISMTYLEFQLIITFFIESDKRCHITKTKKMLGKPMRCQILKLRKC